MTIYDYADLLGELERGVVPDWFAEAAAGRLRPMLSLPQLVRLAADCAYDRLDSAHSHPECAEAIMLLLARFDRVGDRCT
jgi:hypothetical protein